ncbi:hypothetical protein CCACVL1_24172 [Corchorus capsularis]|uniref:Uncharacterized protein n=1 Tax=Corchorus capsularis TaxID=210143 RepID=A0A1R3GQZ4_COCAP|nr:hypothetical protein CCACVL1_24172 [Corchorus capsularis]
MAATRTRTTSQRRANQLVGNRQESRYSDKGW